MLQTLKNGSHIRNCVTVEKNGSSVTVDKMGHS